MQKADRDAVVLRPLGNTGMAFSAVGLGTWNMEHNPVAAVSALRRGIELGANHIDTAEMYGSGQVEEIVGRAVKSIRKNVYLVSKVLPSNATYEGTIAACERSLKRLQTDVLDVYLLHWREKETSIEETFRAFEKLKLDGKIRCWGVSNFSVKDMEEAFKIVGPDKIVCNQVLYHMKERAIEFNLIPWCADHHVSVVAYSPLGQGRIPKHKVLNEIAKTHEATPAQVILAFLNRNPGVISIPKSSNLRFTEENVAARRLRLSDAEIAKIEAAFLAQPRRSLPMV